MPRKRTTKAKTAIKRAVKNPKAAARKATGAANTAAKRARKVGRAVATTGVAIEQTADIIEALTQSVDRSTRKKRKRR